MADDPLELFQSWFAEARASEPHDPEAMALATADAAGLPSVRMVLLKGYGPAGFTFYTNLGSRKAGELTANPHAALLFHWKSLRRQVRVEGPVKQVDEAEADQYFATRARDSQVSAWASEQSRPLPDRATLEQRCESVRERFAGSAVPRPDFWAGYRVEPLRLEFWRDQPHRLHERRLFVRTDRGWDEQLLYP